MIHAGASSSPEAVERARTERPEMVRARRRTASERFHRNRKKEKQAVSDLQKGWGTGRVEP